MFARLLLLFIIVPLIELALFMWLGEMIGLKITLVIIVITGFLGAWLTRVQGRRTWSKFQNATSEGRMPHHEVMDGLMILIAGAVLLTPGFLTDTVGFLLLVPPIRAILKKHLGAYLKKRVQIVGGNMTATRSPPKPAGSEKKELPRKPGAKKPVVIDAEVIDEK